MKNVPMELPWNSYIEMEGRNCVCFILDTGWWRHCWLPRFFGCWWFHDVYLAYFAIRAANLAMIPKGFMMIMFSGGQTKEISSMPIWPQHDRCNQKTCWLGGREVLPHLQFYCRWFHASHPESSWSIRRKSGSAHHVKFETVKWIGIPKCFLQANCQWDHWQRS